MVEIKRETDISIVDKIKGNFVEDGAYTQDVCADEIKRGMVGDNSDVCILVGWDGDKIVGHIVAWVVPDRDYIWLDQCYNSSDPEVAQKGFVLLESWCVMKKIYKIKGESTRKSLPVHRRFGFEEHGVMMVKELSHG
jgi:hypothetical protein